MDKPLDSLILLCWECPGIPNRGGDQSWAKEMLEGYRGDTSSHPPLPSRPLKAWRDPHKITERATLECRKGR